MLLLSIFKFSFFSNQKIERIKKMLLLLILKFSFLFFLRTKKSNESRKCFFYRYLNFLFSFKLKKSNESRKRFFLSIFKFFFFELKKSNEFEKTLLLLLSPSLYRYWNFLSFFFKLKNRTNSRKLFFSPSLYRY